MKIVDGYPYITEIKELITLYLKELNRDLHFQNIENELNDLTKKYQYPHGWLLAAIDHDQVIGCVAYQKLHQNRCEMKRLYVLPNYRNHHIGQQLIENIIQKAIDDGYQEMVLDTIKPLKAAIVLYKKNGFTECQPYYDNPMSDVIYMKKELSNR